MTSDPHETHRRQLVIDSLNELRLLTTCRCDPAYTERGMHQRGCVSEYREEVDILAFALGVGQ